VGSTTDSTMNVNREVTVERSILQIRPAFSAIEAVFQNYRIDGPHVIVHKPQRMSYVRLSPELFGLMMRFDGETSLGRLLSCTEFTGTAFSAQDACDWFALLHRHGLAVVDSASDTYLSREYGRGHLDGKAARRNTLLSRAGNFRLSMKTADRWVSLLHLYFGKHILTGKPLVIMMIMAMAGSVAYAMVIPGYIRMYDISMFIGFDSSTSLGLLFGFVSSAVVHELGHALTCTHFGRKVHSIGLGLTRWCPVLFTDVSDTVMLPRRHRMAVDIAGVAANWFLGSLLAMIVPLTSSAQLSAFWVAAASVNLLAAVINLVPLLNLDGYHLLSDWLGTRHLKERAVQRLLFRGRKRIDCSGRSGNAYGPFLLAYGVLYAIVGVATAVGLWISANEVARYVSNHSSGQSVRYSMLLILVLSLTCGIAGIFRTFVSALTAVRRQSRDTGGSQESGGEHRPLT